jgi:AcrR family transcriptional regulator
MAKVIPLKKEEDQSVEQESSSTKERLLQVAKELFVQKGFHGTSTREITQRARTNLSSLYFHWQSKENLYLVERSIGLAREVLRLRLRNHFRETFLRLLKGS